MANENSLSRQELIKMEDEEKFEARKRKKKRKKIRIRKKQAALLIGVLLAISFFGYNFLRLEYEHYKLIQRKAELQQQLATETTKGKDLQEELDQAGSKSYIEYLAKKYLGLIYPGEKIYVPVDEK